MSISREMAADGRFIRQTNHFTDRITADGSSGFPAAAGRYQLYASYACPWAHRSLIVRRLLGLEDAVGVTIVDPIRDERGWRFTLSPGDTDPVSGAHFLSELYLGTDPAYTGRVTVPCVWDTETKRLVTNDFPNITLMLEQEFTALHGPGAPDLYPAELRSQIDEINAEVYTNINNGVYKAGFATAQDVYEEAVDALFGTLDRLEKHLESEEFLVGGRLTEADVRLWVTLARFDVVYHGHFKCNVRRIADYPALWSYARRLYAIPAFNSTTSFDHIKRHYYATQRNVNPSGVVPKGPMIQWATPTGSSRPA